MRIFYYLSQYVSHLTAGLDYARCLLKMGHEACANLEPGAEGRLLSGDFSREGGGLIRPLPVEELPDAQLEFAKRCDLFVLHEDPLAHDRIYAALPFLQRKRVVAYTAWENEILAPQYIQPLRRVGRVWTCSDFSRQAIAPHVEQCQVLPHLVERKTPPPAELAWAGELFTGVKSSDADAFVFFSVVDAINPRKNLKGLLGAFNSLRKLTSRPVRLLLKQYRMNMDLEGLEGVTSLSGEFSPGRMSALYALCDAYVSAHHSEGWGLGLSSAMAFGKPVIATAYSGNMQFMNESNSLPVRCRMAPVPEVMTELVPLFRPEMQWAEPDPSAMVQAMRRAAEGRLDPELPARAAAIARDFGPQAVMARLEELLRELAA